MVDLLVRVPDGGSFIACGVIRATVGGTRDHVTVNAGRLSS
jgi:hypothetical protein